MSREEYVDALENIVWETWYYTPESDRYKLTAPHRSLADIIHKRRLNQPPHDTAGEPFIGKYGD